MKFTFLIITLLGAALLYYTFSTPGDQLIPAFAGGYMTAFGATSLLFSTVNR